MLIAVDARNSSIAVGFHDGERWRARFRVSAADRTAEEYAYLIASLLRERGVDTGRVEYAALSSVAPSLTPRLYDALRAFLPSGRDPLVVGPGVKTGVRIRTDNPSEVGADLVCSAAAAVARVGVPCLVVDFSSAITFTAIDAPADLVGVSIAPGLEAAVAGLRAREAQLPQIRLERPERAIGRNTVDSIRSGVVLGWTGLVDRLVSQMSLELGRGSPVALVGSGETGDCDIVPSRPFDAWEPYLALDGLELISAKNRD